VPTLDDLQSCGTLVLMNLREALILNGWSALDTRTHPRAYIDTAGVHHGTLEKGGVRLSLAVGFEMNDERGEPIIYLSDDSSSVIVRALMVDEADRRQGFAHSVLAELCRLADEVGCEMFLEPAPIQDKPMLREDLASFYAKYGFSFVTGSQAVMLRPRVQ
jgi:GNAT superfamily N-acetyltransferase